MRRWPWETSRSCTRWPPAGAARRRVGRTSAATRYGRSVSTIPAGLPTPWCGRRRGCCPPHASIRQQRRCWPTRRPRPQCAPARSVAAGRRTVCARSGWTGERRAGSRAGARSGGASRRRGSQRCQRRATEGAWGRGSLRPEGGGAGAAAERWTNGNVRIHFSGQPAAPAEGIALRLDAEAGSCSGSVVDAPLMAASSAFMANETLEGWWAPTPRASPTSRP